MNIKELFNILRRRKWIAIQAFLVIISAAIAFTYLIPPTYQTYATLLVMTTPESSGSSLISSTLKDYGSLVETGSDTEINTAVSLAATRPNADRAIKKYDLKDRHGNPLTPDKLLLPGISAYIFPVPTVTVVRISSTNLFTITCSTKDPKMSQGIANLMAQGAVEDNLHIVREAYASGKFFVDDQIKKVKREYTKYQARLKEFKVNEQTVNLDAEVQVAIEKIAQLYKQKEDNLIDLEQDHAKLRVLKNQVGKMDSTSVFPNVMTENPTVKTQRDKIADIEFQLVKLTLELTDEHPDVISARKQLEKAKKDLEKEVETYQGSNALLTDLERDIASLEVHLVCVNADIDKYLAIFKTLPEKIMLQARLTLQLSVMENLYKFLLQRKSEIAITEATTLSNIRIVDPAVLLPIDYPTKPVKIVNFAVGFVLGTLGGIGLALLFENLDTTIKTSVDIAMVKNVVFLGAIPLIKKGAPLLISQRKQVDPICESYRTVRNSIRFSSLDKPLKRILITSAGPGEGKTLTAVNLSISIAREGKKVLLIDTDLRKSTVHKHFNVKNTVGITNVLLGEIDIKAAIFKTDTEGLFVIPAGPVPVDPARLLESKKMHLLIADLAEKFDTIVLDTAPALVIDDAIIMSPHVDGVVEVVESGRATIQVLTKMEDVFRLAKATLLGVVLNKQKTLRGTVDYYRYYKYYAKSEKSTRDRKA